MSQQELNYHEMTGNQPGASPGTYEGASTHHFHSYGDRDKLSAPPMRAELSAGQRLALAIVSLAMFLILTFGLVGIAVASHPDGWVVFPIFFILVLYTAAAITLNIVFNRKP